VISRKTATAIGKAYAFWFTDYTTINHRTKQKGYRLNREALYDFLYEHNYDAWLCNEAKSSQSIGYDRRHVQEWVMRLHTGESVVAGTQGWSWEARRRLGQQYLHDLAQGILNNWDSFKPSTRQNKHVDNKFLHVELLLHLDLDGYEYKNGRLLAPEYDVLDVEEETGVLQSLYTQLALPNKEQNFQFLKRSEEHYIAGRWDDSIHSSRKFLEGTVREVAAAHCLRVNKYELAEGTYNRAVRVRDYLESEGLLDRKEKEALSSVYGLLSNVGSHPNMAYNDQARLLRHLALTFSQFVMLRLQGSLKNS
jgi:hypothetical protein